MPHRYDEECLTCHDKYRIVCLIVNVRFSDILNLNINFKLNLNEINKHLD